MRLKKLIIHGFKSFADHVEISFENGITGVVGPNGCGKSNISDAVRWVLGEQSAKTLRGAKMEDVIFNGTEKRRRLAFCEVTLVFDNEDHALAIDFAEVSVTRRVYRSGEGEYKINGAACRLRDIIDMFRDTGIGKDGYSLIGQGRIDEILSVKSEDRRQVFEEAAGIVKYKARKQDAQRRIQHTQDNLNRVEDILSGLEERVEPLKAQSEQAREYLTLRDELKVLDINVFLVRTERYEERIRELKNTVQTLGEAILESNQTLEGVSAQRDQAQLELDRYELETSEKRETVQNLIREVEAGEGAVQVMRERIASGERERDRITAQRMAANEGREGIAKRIEEMSAAIEAETASLVIASETLAAKEQQLAEAEAKLADLEERSENAKQQIIQAMNRLGDVRSQRARLSAMKTALENQLKTMEADHSREQTGVEALNEHVQAARALMEEENARKAELDRQAAGIQARVHELGEATARLSEKVTQLQGERQQRDSRLKLLREMQRDYEGYNNSVKQVLLQARRQQGAGVHGVVADLIHVPAKLERAVDMVLGGALQNIVVDRDEDAKRMIEYLRTNRFGRATFLPISSVRGRTLTQQERNVLSMPGCVGLASELVEFDPKYQGVIDNLLGRTVVAEDLTAGIAIQRAGKYQFRLVTLEGDVMHSGGSMTGGSVQSRMTSLLSRTREIEETEKALKAIEAEFAKVREEYASHEEERASLKKDRGELYDELHRQEVVCARAEAQLKAALDEQDANNQRVARMQSERERLSQQLTDVSDGLVALDDMQQSAETSTGDRQAEVKKLQDEIFHLRTDTDRLRTEVGDERVSLASRKRGLEAETADRDRLSEQAENTERLLAESETQLDTCLAELESNAAMLERDIEALSANKEALNAARETFTEADNRRTGVQKKLQTLAEQIDSLRTQLDDFSDKHHRAELQLARVEGEFKQIQDRIWEDYELTYANAEPFRQADFKLTESEKRINAIRQRIRAMGTVNVAAVDEYRRTVERVQEMTTQRDDLLKAKADLEDIVHELETKMEKQFKEQFVLMNENFQRTFVKLFGGGKAELQLTDPKDALNCGIEVVAQPPGKKLQMLSLLSGGERALTAIAILFAILDLKPTPFCILDEIEAALDDANIDTYADYLKSYSENTQFIVITHRKGTMERCDALYGVVMEEKGVSKTVSVKLNEAVG
ncbi:MAG: chromosome segregation protein SMC [Clostridiales bacterium]|nr:chromosome segregation protein SMC [Clostridiales bacterium]